MGDLATEAIADTDRASRAINFTLARRLHVRLRHLINCRQLSVIPLGIFAWVIHLECGPIRYGREPGNPGLQTLAPAGSPGYCQFLRTEIKTGRSNELIGERDTREPAGPYGNLREGQPCPILQ